MDLTEYMIASLMKYVDQGPSRELWVCSSMGQSPVQDYESIESQLLLVRPIQLLKFLGLDSSIFTIKPTMAPRVTFASHDQSALDQLAVKLGALTINGQKIEMMAFSRTLSLRIMHWNVKPEITYLGRSLDISRVGFEMVSIDDKSGTSAYHIPEGVLLIYGNDSSRFASDLPIPTTSINSMIKQTFAFE